MRKKIICLVALFAMFLNLSIVKGKELSFDHIPDSRLLYIEMQLDNIVNYKAFAQAIAGYNKIGTKNSHIVTLIDFSKPSTDERLYVFDIEKKKMLYSSHVAHGRNSGGNYATSFSNKPGSYQSSLGFFLTENAYRGKHGNSLILNGLEKGINDKAKDRAIVIHGAAYADPSVIKGNGRLGRSLGCPALPHSVSDAIISTIKNGSLLFIYANDKDYVKLSSFLES
jgi:hypothetical protein